MQVGLTSVHTGGRAFRVTLLILRVALGGLFLEAGLDKLLSGSFSAAGFLSASKGPFAGFYSGLASNSGLLPIVNNLVIWGEILIGAALILGILVRFSSFWGIVQMILYYSASLPPSSGWINQDIIYIAVFLALMFSGIGYFVGLDRFLETVEKRKQPLRFIAG
jgi:thiosulfate dehydrogenase (quinone) large subunit